VLETVALENGLVIVNSVNCGYLDFAVNFLMAAQKVVSDVKVCILHTDQMRLHGDGDVFFSPNCTWAPLLPLALKRCLHSLSIFLSTLEPKWHLMPCFSCVWPWASKTCFGRRAVATGYLAQTCIFPESVHTRAHAYSNSRRFVWILSWSGQTISPRFLPRSRQTARAHGTNFTSSLLTVIACFGVGVPRYLCRCCGWGWTKLLSTSWTK